MRFLRIISVILIISVCGNEVFGAKLLFKRMPYSRHQDDENGPKVKSESKLEKCSYVSCSPAPKNAKCKVSKEKPNTQFDDLAECCPVYDCKNEDGSTFSHYAASGSKSTATGSSSKMEFSRKGDGNNSFQFKGFSSMGTGSEAEKFDFQKYMPKFEYKPWDSYMKPWDPYVPKFDWGFPNYANMYGNPGSFYKRK